MLDLLGGERTELTELEMVRSKPVPFPPEPFAYLGMQATRWSLDRADHRPAAGTCGCAPWTRRAWATTRDVFASVAADEAERRAARPGDDLIGRPDVVMDRAFTVAAPPAAVWPWLVQLGKKRAGWYLRPRSSASCRPGAARCGTSGRPGSGSGRET